MLQPTLLNRVANAVPGAMVMGLGLYLALDPDGSLGLGSAVLLAGGVAAMRGYRLAVTLEAGELQIRGWLRSRVIPRTAISEVTDFPAVRWTDGDDRGRWSPLLAFATPPSAMASVGRHHTSCLRHIRRWVGGR